MTTPIPFVPDRFRHAAAHYLTGRPAYAPALIRRVAQTCGLDGSQRMLDIGCGPGQLSLAFSTWVDRVLAIDPEPAMLEVATELGAGVAPNIEYRQGSSYDLSPELGRFQFVAIGRAFHWMDRLDTLARLDGMLDNGSAIALFGTSARDDATSPWMAAYRDLMERYAADDPARAQRKGSDWEHHDSVLLRSPFRRLERITIIDERRVSAAQLRARPLSMSSFSRERLGERLDVLLGEIDELAAVYAQDGWLIERVESTALIARR
jgi:SAM-dependent methyltransferase